jgi:hypothetical protein
MTADFAAIITQTVKDGRALIEALMLETCTITREDPDAEPGEMDPVTGVYPEPARITVYAGKCRMQIKSVVASAKNSDGGERNAIVQQSELQLPIAGTDGVAVNDVAELLTSVNDPALVGRVFTVTALHQKSQATARRLPVVEVTA